MTYKGPTDDDAESVVLAVIDDVVAGDEGGTLVKVPLDHFVVFEIEVIHHVLAVRVEPHKIYVPIPQ